MDISALSFYVPGERNLGTFLKAHKLHSIDVLLTGENQSYCMCASKSVLSMHLVPPELVETPSV